MNKRVFGIILALASTAALAQNNIGSVTLTGSIQNAVAIRNPLFVGVSTGTAVNNGGPTAFDWTYDFGDVNAIPVGDLDASGFARLGLTFEMRSNIAYRLTAAAFDNLAPSILPQTAIGFSVKSIAECATPTQVWNSGIRVDTPVPLFDATAGVNGTYNAVLDEITYASTLADAAVQTDILTGERISVRGSLTSPNNYIIVGTEFVFRPELFLGAGNFSHTVTFTAFAVP
jgi:hypothetical protein